MSGDAERAGMPELSSIPGVQSSQTTHDEREVRRLAMTTAEARDVDTTEDHSPMEEWEILTEIVIALVGKPEAVFVEEKHEADSSHFLVHVAEEDLGKVIGKQGETVSTIRKLFGRISASRGRKTFIHIAEPNRQLFSSPFKRIVPRRNAAA
jgi:hypothetical protein